MDERFRRVFDEDVGKIQSWTSLDFGLRLVIEAGRLDISDELKVRFQQIAEETMFEHLPGEVLAITYEGEILARREGHEEKKIPLRRTMSLEEIDELASELAEKLDITREPIFPPKEKS